MTLAYNYMVAANRVVDLSTRACQPFQLLCLSTVQYLVQTICPEGEFVGVAQGLGVAGLLGYSIFQR